jgi:aryl-alcohol dehydrogenase-like predicted oxidoreductase
MRVSPICLGTMTFGTEWGFGSDLEESRRILDIYAERGGNFLDTANIYTGGSSECETSLNLKSQITLNETALDSQ